MRANLHLVSDVLSDEDLQGLARALCGSINRETEVSAAPAEEAGGVGAKGDVVTLGTLALAFLTSGTAVALLQVVKAYLQRDSSLKVKFKRADSQEFEIEARNVSDDRIAATLASLETFMEAGS